MKMPDFRDLYSKYQFWWATKFIKLDVHYTFMHDLAQESAIAVKFLKKFPGVIVEYSELIVGENQLMNFNISVIANPNLCDVESRSFNNYVSQVFRSILHSAIMNSAKELTNENRNADTLQSDSEREVYEEEPPVPKRRVSKRKPRKESV